MVASDLPRDECSETGADCRSSRCCKALGDQCYRKDADAAVCQATCDTETWSCERLGPRRCPFCGPLGATRPAVVIPTYEDDLCKATFLAKSLSRHDPKHLLGDVYLLWVSPKDPARYKEQLDDIHASIARTHKVHMLDFSRELQGRQCILRGSKNECLSEMYGWFAQMALKLKMASVVRSDYYLVLDSKNVLISDVQEETFFTGCNIAKVWGQFSHEEMPEPHKSVYQVSAALLKTRMDPEVWYPASAAPAVLHRDTVLGLLSHIGEGRDPRRLCHGPLCGWFARWATEFSLYHVYALATSDVHCTHTVQSPGTMKEWSNGLFSINPLIRLEECEKVASMPKKILTFGIEGNSLLRTPQSSSAAVGIQDLQEKLRACVRRVYEEAGAYNESAANRTNTTCVIR